MNERTQPQQSQRKNVNRKEYGELIEKMTVNQAYGNLDTLVKVCLHNGIFKDRSEVLSSDKALVIFESLIETSAAQQKRIDELEAELLKLQKPVEGLKESVSE